MDETNGDDPNREEDFKRKLVLDMAKMKDKKQSSKLFQQLKAETGRDCEKLWKQMVHSTTLKLVNLLALNDVSEDVAPVLRLSPDDWLLFDMALVHQIKNITKFTEFNKKLPQCINDLYQLVQNHQVEQLSGDELAKAWIRITLQYNKGGRQVSPMLLQRRWYHLKEMAREQVYNPAAGQDKAKFKLLQALALRDIPALLEELKLWVPDDSAGRRRRPQLLALPRCRTNLLQRAPLTRALRTLNLVAERVDLFCCALNEFTKALYNVVEINN